MFSKIKTIFFDLDNTLFDHRRSETETLKQLMHIHRNSFNGIPDKQLFETYDKHNTMLWREMANGQITADQLKIKRFRLTMNEVGIKNLDCEQLSKQYMQIYSAQRFVISGAHEILTY